jgi:hypothetical protein
LNTLHSKTSTIAIAAAPIDQTARMIGPYISTSNMFFSPQLTPQRVALMPHFAQLAA